MHQLFPYMCKNALKDMLLWDDAVYYLKKVFIFEALSCATWRLKSFITGFIAHVTVLSIIVQTTLTAFKSN